jgi:hypothetical protein
MNDITQFLMGHGGPVLFAIVFAEGVLGLSESPGPGT